MAKKLDRLTAVILALGLLPSMTALSEGLIQSHRALGKYLGPINFLKLGIPILAVFLWQRRSSVGRSLWLFLGSFLALGTMSTLLAGIPCHFPPTLLREWSAMAIGVLAATCLIQLPRRERTGVILFWALLVYSTALMDFMWPDATDWLYAHVFDPPTRAYDLTSTGHRLLSGIFSNQSMSKLLAWTPWLLMAEFSLHPRTPRTRVLWIALGALAVLSTGSILATSQRGPLLGALCGWAALAAHQAFRLKNRRVALLSGGAIGASLLVMFALVPTDMIKTRTLSALGMLPDTDRVSHAANHNLYFRKQMAQLSLHVIATHPLGDACIPEQEFRAFDVFPAHAHHMFLQQYRERGWLWGTFHLLSWLAALALAWRARTPFGSALTAGIVAILISGLADHPWFVLNHAMMLGTFLLWGLTANRREAEHV